jgi:hypothetical protein
MAVVYINSQSLQGTSFTVNIGAGGTGGNGVTSHTILNGSSGGTGGSTSITSGSNTICLVRGGPGGDYAGTSNQVLDTISYTNGEDVNALPITANQTGILLHGMNGGGDSALVANRLPNYLWVGQNQQPFGFPHSMNGFRGCGGGGCGGSITAIPRSSTNAASASGIWTGSNAAYLAGVPGAAGTGTPGVDGESNIYNAAQILGFAPNIDIGLRYGLGTSGPGGGSGHVTNPATIGGGKGGDGGYFGAGGGGGGASSSGSTATSPVAGNGGSGGGGYVAIIEYF